VVIDPMIEKPSLIATLLMLVSGAPYRVGVGGRDNAFAYTLPVRAPDRDVHHTIQEAALLEPFGIDARRTDLHPELFACRAEREAAEAAWAAVDAGAAGRAAVANRGGRMDPARRLLVNISTHHASRRWPEARFTDVIRAIRSLHEALTVIVISLPRDRARAESIAQASGTRVVPTPGLRDALALVATADVVFTPDTSISHAASAFRTPAVVMIGPGRAAFEPFDNTGELLRAATDDFASITAADATQAIDAVLAHAAAHR
jgi:ADP-heptose:LPS heptosyltransferase